MTRLVDAHNMTAKHCVHSLAVAVIACCGCGGGQQVIEGRTIVSGTVTLDGQPLRGGSVTFTSKENSILAKTANIESGGKYLTYRAPTGKSVVSIETESLQFGNAAAYVPIPAKYTSAATSGFEVDLQPGENENVDFALETQPKG
jgi:hypothetical protein